MAEFEVSMPWPMYHRACFVQACGMQIPEEDAWILTLSSVNGDQWMGHEIKRNPEMVYVAVNRCTFYFKRIDENTQLLQAISNADPQMTYIPATLINFGLKIGISAYLELLQTKSENLAPEYEALLEEKNEVYDEVRRQLQN